VSDVNANIGIHFDTADALAQLRRLQAGLSKFNQSLTQGNIAAENAQKGLNAQLIQSINATGKFVASQKNIVSSTTAFTDALEKNKLSMGQYFKFTAAAATANTKVFKNAFASEREIINRARKDRVKALQTQYIQLTNANGELVKVLQVVPKHLKMVNGEYADYATRTQMAAQRQQLLNQLLKQGSTQLLNFGKNTQWAGRQLMVGFTVPLTMLGSVAAKAFKDMEEAVIKFQRVYGDMATSIEDTDKAVRGIQLLAKEFTKYGIAASETVKMAADAAAMGLTGADLTAQVTAATKLAVLGQVEQQQALETTISLQNAFGISAEELAKKINFLNAVENQTVLSIADLTEAIPKAGPVVKQLGGSVEDLAFFMTAMKEGGINASEGANALKSGLASLINPSKKASEMLAGFGINVKGLVDANAGDLKGTVIGFARALDTLDPLNRARAIETMFGKFQFARLSTLFQNITKDSSQAARALGLAGASVEELAILSERELGKVENAVGVKFQKQMENIKLQLVPIGKAFLEAVTPIAKFAAGVLEKFNNLGEGTKKFVVGMVGFLGLIAPAALMTFGLLANGVANLIKFFAMLRGGMAKLNGQNNVLGGGFDYLTQQEIENLAQSEALHTSHKNLISTFNVEAASVNALATAYQNAASQARALASGSPGLFNTSPGPSGAVSGLPKKFATGGVVPGTGNKDTVPALLTPGEFVVTKENVKNNPELVAALANGNVQKFSEGGVVASQAGAASGKTPGWLQKEYDRISALSDTNLKRYAELTGMGVDKTMDEIRAAVLKNFEELLDEVKAKTGSLTKEGLEKIGKAPGQDGSPSIMGRWFKKFDEGQGGSFAHVGQTEKISADKAMQLNVAPEIAKQMEIVKKYYEAKGQKAPDVRVADAFGFTMKQSVNRGMASEDQTNFKEKYGKSVGDAFQEDFAKTGAEKWRTMTELVGADFDKVKDQAEIYDKALLDKVTSWNAENAKKDIPEPFTDDVFRNLEKQVREDISGLIPDFAKVIETAKKSITALRTSIPQSDLNDINAELKTQNAGSLGPKSSNAKYGNVEARTESELLGTIETLPDTVEKSLSEAEKVAETQSPSKRTRRLGVNIGEGLRIGLEQKTAEVKSQADKMAESSIPKVDTVNQAKYDALKNDPNQRQIQKSIDRHYRDKFGVSRMQTPASSSTTSMTVDVNPKALAKDIADAKKARTKAKQDAAVKNAKASAKEAGKTRNAQEQVTDSTEKLSVEQDKYTNEVKKAKKKAKKTADAAGDVLVAENDIANSANLTSSAAQAQAQNTISAAELTQATENALVASADNNNQINNAEEDRVRSAEETAKLQNDIEELKRKEKERGMAAVAASGQTPIIPEGSQTDNKFVNPATAMSYENAYEEASAYTRDRNGQLLLDPETGRPTTLTKKQIGQKKRGMRREKVGKFSGKVSGGLGTAAMVAGMAGAPPQVTAALGTAATLAQFAPMLAGLSGPQAAVAGLVALGASAYLLNKKLQGTAEAIAKFTRTTTVSSDLLQKIGEQTGKVGANQVMNRRRGEGSLNTYIETGRKGTMEATKFLEGEAGKALQKAYKENASKFGADVAAKDFALQLAAAISDGTIPEYLGAEIAYQMGVNLRDAVTGIRIKANLRSLIGPGGEDLLKDPLVVRTRLATAASQKSADVYSQMTSSDQSIVGNNSGLSRWATLGLIGNASGSDKSAALAVTGSSAIETAQAQADAMQLYYDNQLKTLQNELAATANKEKQLELQTKIKDMIDQQNAGMKQMNNLVASQLTIQVGYANKMIDTVGANQVQGQGFWDLSQHWLNDSARREDAYFDAQKADVKAKYKGTEFESSAQRVLDITSDADEDSSFANKVEGRTFEAKMNLIMQSGQMNPAQVETMLKIFEGNLKDMDLALNIGMRTHGGAKMAELASLLVGVDKKKARSIVVQMSRKNPEEFDRVGKTLAILQRSDGLEVDMTAFIDTVGMPGLEALSKKLDSIEALKDPITKEVAIKWAEDNNVDPAQLIDDWEYYDALKPEVRKEALQTYTTLFTTATSFKTVAERDAWAVAQAEIAAAQKGGIGSNAYKTEYSTVLKLLTEGPDGKPLPLNDYNAAAEFAQRGVVAIHGTPSVANSKDAPNNSDNKDGNRDTTYDDLLKRLRNVRLAAIDASKGFKELQRAIAATGSKAIKNQFNGLEQQLIKMGQTQQFTDYLAGLDQSELNKFGKTATKKGTQKYTTVDPVTGKKITKTQKYKAGDFVLNQKGRDMEVGFNKAIIGDYNKAQLLSITYAKQEIAARTKLAALGFDQRDIATMLADENYKTLIATGKVTKQELETNAALTQQARLRASISGAVTKYKDDQAIADNQKRIPEVVQMMQMANISAEGIRSAISDPSTLEALINGMDNFATLGQDAQNEFRTLLDQINDIPDRKLVEIVFTQSEAQKEINAANAAAELFDAYKMIDENTLKNAEGNTYAGLQVQMDALNNQAKIAQDRINLTQSQIETLQLEVDKDQREIDTKFTRPIEQKQRAIDKLNRTAEMNFIRPIQALQDRSNILSHDLEVMNHTAEQINEKYDKQQEALSKVSEINQQIIQQQQQQLGLADALTQGDIAAAARAAQDMRATSASNYAQNAQEALQQARQNEIDSLRGGVSGKSQKDIQEEQYQIGQQVYGLEQGKAAIDKQILSIQDEIYNLEQQRIVAQDAIQVKMDKIAEIQYGTLLNQQADLKAINDKMLPLQLQSDLLFKQIADADAVRVIQGATRAEWDAILKAATATEKLASNELALALGAVGDMSGKAKTAWDGIKAAYDGIKSKSIEITQYIKTVYGPATDQTGNGPDAKYDQKNQEQKKEEQASTKSSADIIAERKAKYGYISSGGIVPKYFAKGGFAIGTDTVPAMLTPGEFVMSRYAVNNHGVDKMKAINSGAPVGETVYNYSLTVNTKSDASPDDIARTVMAQIRQIDSQRIRGNRF
jgi:hypothetical protein